MEEYVRSRLAEMYGGADRLGRLVAELCKKAPGVHILDVPCLLMYSATRRSKMH